VKEKLLLLLPCSHERFAVLGEDPKELAELINEGLVEVKTNDKIEYLLTEKGKAKKAEIEERQITPIIELQKKVEEEQKEWELRPGGCVIKEIRLVCEPLSEKEMVYNYNGRRGIAEIREAKGGLCYVEIEKKRFWIRGRPLEENDFMFQMPDREAVLDWVAKKRNSKPTGEIIKLIKNTVTVFLEFSDSKLYDFATLAVVQSWLKHVLPVYFYTAFFGEWGGGKSTSGEVLTNMCYHGYFISNTSVPFIGRCLDKLEISPFIDELDATQNEELLAIIRQGYRRSGFKYSRMSEHGERPQSFIIETPWIFSVHGMTEEALLSRCFPITLAATTDKQLPIINIYKKDILDKVYTEVFIWYMDSIVDIVDIVDSRPIVDIVDLIGSKNPVLLRDGLFRGMVNDVNLVNQLDGLLGRDLELGYILLKIAEITGINLEIKDIMNLRKEAIEEIREVGVVGMFRDWIVKKYEELKDNEKFRNSQGEFMITNKDVYNLFNDYLRATKNFGINPSNFKAMIQDLGFSGDCRKKMKCVLVEEQDEEPKSRLALIFGSRVCTRIGMDYDKMVKEGKALVEQKKLSDEQNEIEEAIERTTKK
jgi:hypothetical protein